MTTASRSFSYSQLLTNVMNCLNRIDRCLDSNRHKCVAE